MIARAATALSLAATLAAGCGGDGGAGDRRGDDGGASGAVRTTQVEVVGRASTGEFAPTEIYERLAPGVVTVISVFGERDLGSVLRGDEKSGGLGSGFVISDDGEVATNAHVVTTGTGNSIKKAREVYVSFGDGNQVVARIVGHDPNSDVALLRVEPDGLRLRPLILAASSQRVTVGAPVAAIGSPFGEPQSLSVGVVSGKDRAIESLTGFAISGAIQTDAAINHGNSGGPLVDAAGEVIGINSQIESTGGGGEGVGFAVPIETVRRALAELRSHGRVQYAFLGVSTTAVYPQLAERFDLAVDRGAWVQEVTSGSPADKAGLRAGSGKVMFQAREFAPGGDVLVKVDGLVINDESDVSQAIADRRPGDRVAIELLRGKTKRRVTVRLDARPGRIER